MPFKPACPEDAVPVVMAWNWMGGQIDWSAIPVIVEMLGIDDVDGLVRQLVAMRDHITSETANG